MAAAARFTFIYAGAAERTRATPIATIPEAKQK